jgi:hypothetical protein
MAETAVFPNNKSVEFRGKPEREMPRPPNMDVSAKPGKKNPAGINKGNETKRKHVKRAMKRGMVSEKAAKKHLSGY